MSTTVVAITGSNGYLGRHLAQFMAAAGWTVRRLERPGSPSHQSGTHGQLAFVLGQPIAASSLQGVDVLVHCAHDYEAKDTALDVNVAGAEALFRVAHESGVGHLVFVSSTHAFEGCRSHYGRTKRAIEEMAIAYGGSVVRAGTLFSTEGGRLSGGVRGGTLRQMEWLAGHLPILPVPASRAPSVYLTHVDDLCALILEIANGNRAAGAQPIVAANNQPYTLHGLLRAIRRRGGGRPLRMLPFPWQLGWLMAWLLEQFGVKSIRSESMLLLFDQDPAPQFESRRGFQTEFRRL